ncbi:MAG: hypothetical protein AAGA16_01285 [Cyanobacteria bacterium P01_E01_bin.35]
MTHASQESKSSDRYWFKDSPELLPKQSSNFLLLIVFVLVVATITISLPVNLTLMPIVGAFLASSN